MGTLHVATCSGHGLARRARGALVGLAALAAACGAVEPAQAPDPPCAPSSGEFPPTDCAFLVGTVESATGFIGGWAVGVDSFVRPRGFAYLGGPIAIRADGSFALLVFRVNRFEPLQSPDTADLVVEVFPDLTSALRRLDPIARFPVTMTFAPLGVLVDTTRAVLRVDDS